ncbi:MAG TPA: CHAD domain-containing protein [Paraburkholderia sp.]|nr:CHAD domain-containing protein [Paraburkholderia sp.]
MRFHKPLLATERPEVRASASSSGSSSRHQIGDATSASEAFLLLATSLSAEAVRRVHALDARADPEILHKLRVALRRMRSLWWAYEPLLDRENAVLQRREFRYLADAAGKTRDWDVLREILASGPAANLSQDGGAPFPQLLQAVDAHRADALSFSRRTIRGAQVETILQQAVESARQQLAALPASPVLATFAEERVRRAEASLRKRIGVAVEPEHREYAALHSVRIAGKKVRYLLEFFSPVLDASHRQNLERLTTLQDELGKLNDLVVSETLLREYSFQLGDQDAVHEVIALIAAEKKRHMRVAHAVLHAL